MITTVLCAHANCLKIGHLFFECNFSTRIWAYLQIFWGGGSGPEMLQRAKNKFKGPCFTEIVILACWNIWKQRNDKIFRFINPTFRAWKYGFVKDVSLLKHRVKKCTVPLLSSWIDNLM
jgi:hypothetical protein